jgi:hypothetical protein
LPNLVCPMGKVALTWRVSASSFGKVPAKGRLEALRLCVFASLQGFAQGETNLRVGGATMLLKLSRALGQALDAAAFGAQLLLSLLHGAATVRWHGLRRTNLQFRY